MAASITSIRGIDNTKVLKIFFSITLATCVLPFLLNLLGIDFGSQHHGLTAEIVRNNGNEVDAMHHTLAGSFVHTILEWSAFMAALFTAILAFTHFKLEKDIVTPIIGVALFCSGCMDAFHTLAADRLIDAVADNRNLIPFTWAISRLFNALIMIVGVGICCLPKFSKEREGKRGFGFIIAVSLIFGIFAYGIIHVSAVSQQLPETMFPDSFITRPWDVIPLLLFLFAGFVLYPRFHKSQRTIFSFALIISIIPEVATQLHMSFGSTMLFDNHFNIAHFLKIIAYFVPFVGLLIGYVLTYKEKDASESKINSILQGTGDAIRVVATDGTVLRANNKMEELLGIAEQDRVRANFDDQYGDKDFRDNNYTLKHILAGKSKVQFESVCNIYGGGKIPLEVIATPLMINGKIAGVIECFRDITERKEAEVQISKWMKALKRSNRELDEFAHIASHDLKEPLRGIHNYSQFLLEDYGEKLDKEGVNKLETLVTLTQRMETIINSLLEFSRLNMSTIAYVETDLNEIVGDVIESLKIRLTEEKIDIRIPRTLPVIKCDKVLITQLFSNLITNAIKYGDKPERWIEIGYEDTTESSNIHTLYVADNGIGIRESQVDEIFRLFKRLHGRDKFGGGTGIGLTIAKKTVERHGGAIWVESEYGVGSKFKFTIDEAQNYEDSEQNRTSATDHYVGGGQSSGQRSDDSSLQKIGTE